MTDGSFHSPEWHAARLASLNKTHTVTWEEFKKKQKEEELKRGELEADKDKMMREYRAQLDAERAQKLANGRNHWSNSKSSYSKKEVHQSQVPAYRQNLPAAMMRIGVQGSPDHDLVRREQSRKRSTDQGPSTETVKVRKVQFASLNSSGSKE
uniref:Uncharacterized protein n=1 Tax=Zea mays TaxID=4577 RepID=A0A804ME27_MAIZE